ncbi:hypothetical protein AYO38_00640 [bacterium SCGC AG-212-C10]|nr:hypothetical protein AYO38_00640 [bacterium SCGC AG-212-C10]
MATLDQILRDVESLSPQDRERLALQLGTRDRDDAGIHDDPSAVSEILMEFLQADSPESGYEEACAREIRRRLEISEQDLLDWDDAQYEIFKHNK